MHVQHRLNGMTDMTDPCRPQVVQYPGDPAIFGNLCFSNGVIVQGPDDHIRYPFAHTDSDTRKLRQCADIVVVQLHVSGSLTVIHRFVGLQCHQYDGDVNALDDNSEGIRGRIRKHITENKVQVTGFKTGYKGISCLHTVYHSEVHDRYIMSL